MADPFLSEIRIFAGNFAPVGWAVCNGQLLPVSQNTALFSLLGNTYGGDGKTTFALPNLQGSAPMSSGRGPGLSLRSLGERGGAQTVTLLQAQMPAHTHAAQAASSGGVPGPGNAVWASAIRGQPPVYAPSGASKVSMNPQGTAPTGGGQPHNNMAPYLCMTFIIALQGIYPPRG